MLKKEIISEHNENERTKSAHKPMTKREKEILLKNLDKLEKERGYCYDSNEKYIGCQMDCPFYVSSSYGFICCIDQISDAI